MQVEFFYLPILSFVISYLLLRILIIYQTAISIQDIPKERSLHAYPIPRTGGLGIIFSILVSCIVLHLILPLNFSLLSLAGFFLVFLVSLIDDIKDLSPFSKLFFQIIAINLVIYDHISYLNYDIILILIIFFLCLWFLNLYNFMDGLDGLCGFMSLTGFLFFSIIFFNKNSQLSLFSLICFGSVLAFFLFNFPPAKIFLGDAGSISIAYIIIFLSLEAIIKNHIEFIQILIVFNVFIYDATKTLVYRILKGHKPWKAHREHLYQKLATSNLGKYKTLYLYMSLISLSFLTTVLIKKNSLHIQIASLFFLLFVLLIIEFYVSKLYLKK